MISSRIFPAAAISMLLGACTMVGAPGPASPTPVASVRVPPPAPARHVGEEPPADPAAAPAADPAPADAEGPSSARVGEEVVRIAMDALGTPYLWGGEGEEGFDCSGLIQFAYGQMGVRLPRVSTDQLRAGTAVEAALPLLQAGDVLGFSNTRSGATDHVGLYVGEGRFIHSSSSGVRISTLLDPYWRSRLVSARRIVG